MRTTLILFTILLLSVIYANSKSQKSEGKDRRCDDRRKGGEEERKIVDSKEEESEEFRWNKNFKKHKLNAYENYYKPKGKPKKEAVEKGKAKAKKYKSKTPVKFEEAPEDVSKSSKQCDSGEDVCSSNV